MLSQLKSGQSLPFLFAKDVCLLLIDIHTWIFMHSGVVLNKYMRIYLGLLRNKNGVALSLSGNRS